MTAGKRALRVALTTALPLGVGLCVGAIIAASVSHAPSSGAVASEEEGIVLVTPEPVSTEGPVEVVVPEATPVPVLPEVTDEPEPPAIVAEDSQPIPAEKGPLYAPRPADTDPAEGPVNVYDDYVLFCGVNAGVAIDTDPFGNNWAYCEPAMVEAE